MAGLGGNAGPCLGLRPAPSGCQGIRRWHGYIGNSVDGRTGALRWIRGGCMEHAACWTARAIATCRAMPLAFLVAGEQLHFPGQDLPSEFPDAPHKEEVFKHDCVIIVGRLTGVS